MKRKFDLRSFRNFYDLTQTELGKYLGVTNVFLSQIESGKSDMPDEKLLRLIDNDKGWDVDRFIEGVQDSRPKGQVLIPFYDDVASMGGMKDSAEMQGVSDPTDYIDTGDWFRNATAAIRHYGDSMIEYPSGCILAIREVKDRRLVVPGRNYVIETSEYRVTKRLQIGKDENYFAAYSTNMEQYPDGRLINEPFEIEKASILRLFMVLGYVVMQNGGTLIYGQAEP